MRLDSYISKKYNISRSKAQILISLGFVRVNNVIKKFSYDVKKDDTIDIMLLDFVSRAELKLAYFIKELNAKGFRFDFNNKLILDVGTSTGGFSHYFLSQNASVVGIDVNDVVDERVKSMKNFRFIKMNAMDLNFKDEFDFASCDISNLDPKLYIHKLLRALKPNGYLFFLFKPQYLFFPPKRVDEREALKLANEFKSFVEENENGKIEYMSVSKLKGKTKNTGTSEVWMLIKRL